MSAKHPVIAVTGSSGAGTTMVKHAFEDTFRREGIHAVFAEGNSFRRFDRAQMKRVVAESIAAGRPISHFGPEANLFDRLEALFKEYSRTGTGLLRSYAENETRAEELGVEAGSFSPWADIPPGSDLLFYEGLHGGCVEATWTHRHLTPSHNPFIIEQRHKVERSYDTGVDVAQWVDLLIGVTPSVNLEWIQKIQRDTQKKGESAESVTATILRRMPDYIRYILPQFSFTDLNFQRVPMVDTSNPFIARDVPNADESVVVIRFREARRFDFPYLLSRLPESFMSRPNDLVIPGGDLGHALEVICGPLVHELLERRRK
jgi:phosphoribulokinase